MTASYKLTWKSSAERELRQLPKEVIIKLLALAESLSQNPFPSGVKNYKAHNTLIVFDPAITVLCMKYAEMNCKFKSFA